MNLRNQSNPEMIFGLDIGTRTVIGVVGYQQNEKFVVSAIDIVEHESRAMIDGQIHDVAKVAKTALQVKQNLERRLDISLTKVAIAAAGRALRTYHMHVEQTFDEQKEIDRDLIRALELEGIHKAQQCLQQELSEEEWYFCVGYSVVNYYLNGYVISNLEGHKGKKVGADVLATFLPQVVVDSLYMVMERVGLEVISLTLEPIAAINVAIPENLRLLNLALVDVGAGTSDIAITKEGSIIAYGMISIAGDEITEQIVHSYLVDFQTAEQIKLQIQSKEEIQFTDILGLPFTKQSNEIHQVIEPAVERLTEEVASKILEINGDKSPNAVFCVGGGSQVKGFTSKVAGKLKLVPERVAVRGSEILSQIVYEDEILKGPALITPIGICVTALLQRGYEFITVRVNEEAVKLINTKKLTVMDAGMLKGYDHTNLISRKGKSLQFKLNGQRKKIWGQPGVPAELWVNGVPASLDTPIKQDDQIWIQPAVHGEDAKAFVIDFVEACKMHHITVNGSPMKISTIATINGNIVSMETEVGNEDEVRIWEIQTIQDLSDYAEMDIRGKEIYINDCKADASHLIQDGDRISITNPIEETNTVAANLLLEQNNGHTIEETKTEKTFAMEDSFDVLVNGETVFLEDGKGYMFVDIFNFIDFDLKKPQGNIVLLLNGQKAGFTDPIRRGDRIDIYWDKK